MPQSSEISISQKPLTPRQQDVVLLDGAGQRSGHCQTRTEHTRIHHTRPGETRSHQDTSCQTRTGQSTPIYPTSDQAMTGQSTPIYPTSGQARSGQATAGYANCTGQIRDASELYGHDTKHQWVTCGLTLNGDAAKAICLLAKYRSIHWACTTLLITLSVIMKS